MGEAQTPQFHDFGIFERVPEPKGYYSPNSFPAIGVLAGLVRGLVVVPHSRAAKWLRPFVAIYMTW